MTRRAAERRSSTLRRFALPVAATLAGALVGVAAVALTPPIYEGTAILLPHGVLEGVPDPDDASPLAEARSRTLATVAVRPLAVDEVVATLGDGVTVDDVAVYTTVEDDSWLVVIHGRSRSGDVAARLANGVAQRAVDAGMAADIVEPAEPPSSPVEPRPLLLIFTGATVGLALGIAAAMLRRGQAPGPAVPPDREVLRGTPWVIALVVIALIVVAVGVRAPPVVMQLLAGIAGFIAVARPAVGLAIVAVVLPMRDIELLGPLDMRLALTAALAFGVTLDVLARRARVILRPWVVLIHGYIAVSALATLPILTGLEGVRAFEAIAQLSEVTSVTFLVIAASIVFQRVDPLRIVMLGLASAAIVGLVVLVQWLTGSESGLVAGYLSQHVTEATRAIGPFNNSNYLGMFSAIGVAICAGLWITGAYSRPFLLVVAASCAVAAALSFSRAAILASAAGLLVALWLANRWVAVVVAGSAAFTLAVLYPIFLDLRLEQTFGDYSALANVSLSASDTLRGQALQAGVDLALARPFFGGGFAQFQFLSPQVVNAAPVTFPHNEYLKLLAEQGIVGSLPLLAAVGLAVRAFVAQRGAVSPLLPVAVAYSIGALFVEPLASFQTSGLMWLLVGAAVAVTGPLTAPAPDIARAAVSVAPGATDMSRASRRRARRARSRPVLS